jgi:hypothetical protein
MKTLFAAFGVLSMAACTLPAQSPTMSCEHQGNHNRPNFCEIRENTIAASSLTIDGHQNGGITIRGADRSDILVRAMVQALGDTDSQASTTGAQVIVHTSGGAIQSDGPRDSSWSVSYEIFIPRHTSLGLKTRNGGVTISGVESNIEFHSVNGGITLKDVGGYIHGETVNGGVSVNLDSAAWNGQGMDVSTSNGGVSMKVPERFSALLDIGTINGGMSLHLPNAQPVRRGETHLSLTLGTGGPLIRVRTHNGGVSISTNSGKV